MEPRLYSHSNEKLAIVFNIDEARLHYLGVESGARKRSHLDTNLLRPGIGGSILPDNEIITSSKTDNGAVWETNNCTCRLETRENCFHLFFQAKEKSSLTDTLFKFSLAPDITPASLWARPENFETAESPINGDPLKPKSFNRKYHTPGLISLPEYGLLQCSASQPVTIIHSHHPDKTNAGFNLGFANFGNHNLRRAYHHGHFEFSFIPAECENEVELVFSVMPEIYPEIPEIDLSDRKWNGLKRHWMSNFTLNPPTLTLGDNPILGGTGHLAVHWKSDISVYTPELLSGISLHDFFRNALRITFEKNTDASGKMKGYGWENGATNIIALHAYLLGTGDWDFVESVLPIVEKVISYNLSLDTDNDGILEALYHGNDMHGEITSLNWWDAFAFGHKDAYGNLVYYQAFSRILPVLEKLGASGTKEKLQKFMDKFRNNFHTTFYNKDTGVYAGWISRDGKVHDYMFTFITAMAINEGLVEKEQAKEMLTILLEQLQKSGYGEYKYGIPGPAIEADVNDRTDWAIMGDWGRYEHGGFCGQTAYHFLMALYNCDMREQADCILFKMLDTFEEGPTHSGLTTRFGQSVDWRTREGQPCGYNYLADNYVFLLAALQGHFKIPLPPLPERK